ncbi:glycosyltransferase family 4 protein [Ornithinibacillus halophilus]|uniref:Glycosyltransferase involved in cell wall bisynthesis n=1 Tax=Ornithinibacillus halophilus TaxID=930117 RepID=A0A1M5KK47_9BACI|nr:glycosyltransferase family 4 protein [Ornithinibacillus halophilus]SHG53108.1 Glycosyltransferase involved in cell wall bisynthesis [Ornithinibacillus halophilus]
MKIVQFVTRMDVLGGAQVHVRDLAIHLKERGHDVVVVSRGRSSLTEELAEKDIPYYEINNLVVGINPYRDLLAYLELQKLLKKIRPDLMAVHSSKAGILGRLAGKRNKIPTVFTAHGWSFTDGVSNKKRLIYKSIERMAGRMSQGVITVSEYDYHLAVNNKIIAPSKLKVVHNGVPDTAPMLRSTPRIDPPIITMVARFAYPKDHVTLIRVLHRIKHLPWKLELIGDGPLLQENHQLVNELGLTDKVHFYGAREDVPELLAKSQLFVLISEFEGLPLSIIEAMRSRLPVIASNVGGVRELVSDSQTGFLIEKGNDIQLKECLESLLKNQELREQMGTMGRSKYEEEFTFTKMLNETYQFYQKVMEE